MSQGGMVSIFQDFPMSPDMVSEVKVLTSNYAPEYGSSTSGQIMAVTKSGGSSFHGAGLRVPPRRLAEGDAVGRGRASREFNRNNYGANIGGPAKLPGLWSDKVKSYFYLQLRGLSPDGRLERSRRCRFRRSQERNGDFTDWRDAAGNLIPIYDPATHPAGRQRGLHQGSVHGLRRQHAERDLSEPHQPDRAAVAGGAADSDQRRSAEQLPRAGDSRHDPRQLRLLHGPVRSADREQRPHVRELLAPARAGQVRVGAAAADRQRDLLRSAELVGQPVQLGPHLQQHAAEPHVDGVPEPQRGVRLGEPGASSTTSRRSPASRATTCRRR